MPWYVIYTKPNNEKKVASLLEKKGLEVYCPLYETVKQWSDRKKKVRQPLFRSYVFVLLDNYDSQKAIVLLVPGAVRFLWWTGKPAVVRDEEIEAIRNFLNANNGAKIAVNFSPGNMVQIKAGPLTGHTGELMFVRGNKGILVIKSFGCSLTAEISLALL